MAPDAPLPPALAGGSSFQRASARTRAVEVMRAPGTGVSKGTQRRFLLLVFGLFMVGGSGVAAAASSEDASVQRALRASLLGDAAAVRAEAAGNSEGEEALGEEMEALALGTDRPIPTLGEARRALKPYDRDAINRTLDRLIRRSEPRQRFFEARKDRRYDDVRRTFNALASPFASAAQGQFFPLITLPFDIVETVVVGRPYLTPEQRRELKAARAVEENFGSGALGGTPARVDDSYTGKRQALAAIQARQNTNKAVEEQRPVAAQFWWDRESKLRGTRRVNAGVLEGFRGELARDRASVAVIDGDAALLRDARAW